MSLNGGFGACHCGSPEIDFLRRHAHNLPQTGKSSQPIGKSGHRMRLLNGSKLRVCESALSIRPRSVFGLGRRLVRYRECSRRRGHVGRPGLPSRVSVRLGRRARLACGSAGEPDDSAGLRSAAKAQVHIACIRGKGNCPHAGVRFAVVSR